MSDPLLLQPESFLGAVQQSQEPLDLSPQPLQEIEQCRQLQVKAVLSNVVAVAFLIEFSLVAMFNTNNATILYHVLGVLFISSATLSPCFKASSHDAAFLYMCMWNNRL